MYIRKEENQNIEFKLNWQDEYLKWIAAFANSNGGTLLIGVDDKGYVQGVEKIHELSEQIPLKIVQKLGLICSVEILYADDDRNKKYLKIVVEKHEFPITYNSRFYVRIGSTTQEAKGAKLAQLSAKVFGLSYDNYPLEDVDINELSDEAINYFKECSLQSTRLLPEWIDISKKLLLQNLNLISTNGKLVRAAVLAFHPTPELWNPGAYIKIGFFDKNEELRFDDEIHGPIILQAKEVTDKLYSKYIKTFYDFSGMQRKEIPFIPQIVFRELLFNAIIHKDYTMQVPIQIKVYEDKLLISNPGTFPSSIHINALYEPHPTIPTNIIISTIFFKCGFIETWGRGFIKIREQCTKYNCPLPIIKEDGEIITAEYHPSDLYLSNLKSLTTQKTEAIINNHSSKENDLEQERITLLTMYLQVHKEIKANEAATLLDLSPSSTRRLLSKAVDDGLIVSNGENKGRYYSLTE